MNSLVTVAIPFYNDHTYLKMAIQSVINQSFTSWELILMDDGSTDGSLEIAKSFTSDKRITVHSDGKNKGLPFRLNEIISMVNSDFYARMDADDIMNPNRLEIELNYLHQHPEIDVLGTFAYVIDDNNKVFGKTFSNILKPSTTKDIFDGGAFIHPSIMGKTIWFKKHPYNTDLRRMQDLALWISSVEYSKFEILPEYLLFYRTGKTTANKYLKTQIYSRKFFYSEILKKEKKILLFLKLYCKSIIKTIVYSVVAVFSDVDIIIKKRYLGLSDDEINIAVKSLRDSIKV